MFTTLFLAIDKIATIALLQTEGIILPQSTVYGLPTVPSISSYPVPSSYLHCLPAVPSSRLPCYPSTPIQHLHTVLSHCHPTPSFHPAYSPFSRSATHIVLSSSFQESPPTRLPTPILRLLITLGPPPARTCREPVSSTWPWPPPPAVPPSARRTAPILRYGGRLLAPIGLRQLSGATAIWRDGRDLARGWRDLG